MSERQMMSGAWAAKEFVSKYLKANMGKYLTTYRNIWNLAEEDVPTPNGYWSRPVPSIEHFEEPLPIIYTVIINTESIQRLGWTINDDPDYRVTYATRSYVWVKHAGIDATVRSRDHLMMVMRSAMLDHQALEASPLNTCDAKFAEESLQEYYSDLVPPLKGDRYAAGGYLAYDLTINEVITRPKIGTVADFEIEAGPLDA